MTAAPTPTPSTTPLRGSFQGLSDLKLIARQTRYEQLSFWLNPVGAIFTIGFSTVFLLIFEATSGHTTIAYLGHIKLDQYYVPGFVAYGIMSSCFSILSITMVNRREMGLLKRLRLSPAPTWVLMSAIFLSTMAVVVVQLVLMLGVGRAYGVHGPASWLPFIIGVLIGMFAFTMLGLGVSTLVPNADAAGPVVNIIFFVLLAFSGLYYPINPGSLLAKITNYFPIRRLITAMQASFNHTGASPWDWHDLGIIAIWGAVGLLLALRRWQWQPRRG